MQAHLSTLKKSSKTTTPTASKAFCPVCKNAGLSAEEYTSHWTRASPRPDAPVVCPTILNATCSYCKGKGHFKKNCLMLTSLDKPPMRKDVKSNTEQKIPKNIYNVFNQKEKPLPQKVMDFPPLTKTVKKQQEPKEKSYAEMAAMEPPQKKLKTKEPVTAQEVYVTLFSKCEEEEPVKDLWINEEEEYPKRYDIKQNWADNNYWSDDEF